MYPISLGYWNYHTFDLDGFKATYGPYPWETVEKTCQWAVHAERVVLGTCTLMTSSPWVGWSRLASEAREPHLLVLRGYVPFQFYFVLGKKLTLNPQFQGLWIQNPGAPLNLSPFFVGVGEDGLGHMQLQPFPRDWKVTFLQPELQKSVCSIAPVDQLPGHCHS